MDRLLLTQLPAVLAVARTRSFAKAAAELGIGASAVSHAIRAAELRLGAPLFSRTTRSVSLTEAGETFVAAASDAFDAIDTAADQVRAAQGDISGLLRINAPHVALHLGLTSILMEMTRRHPGLMVEIIADDKLSDVVAEGFDAGIRLGEMIAQDMVAVRMTPPLRAVMVASPRYLEQRGTPQKIDDLADHNCIGYRLLGSGAIYDWDIRDADREVKAPVSGTTRVSDSEYARVLALAGMGIAYLFDAQIVDELAKGNLVEILPQASIMEPGLFLYFPRRASEASKLRAFVDVIRANLGKAPQRPVPAVPRL
jgi:DNA-binding transcriptional LysR family regulator